MADSVRKQQRPSPRGAIACGLAAAALAGCGGDAAPAAPETIRLGSPLFADGKPIPRANSCDGAGRAPTLAWSGVPADAKELVLTVEDPDASFTHWTVYGMAVTAARALADGRLPAGVPEGRNSAGKDGWTPPCPPKGDAPHHYVFTLYALARASGLHADAEPSAVRAAVTGALARGQLTGTYARR